MNNVNCRLEGVVNEFNGTPVILLTMKKTHTIMYEKNTQLCMSNSILFLPILLGTCKLLSKLIGLTPNLILTDGIPSME